MVIEVLAVYRAKKMVKERYASGVRRSRLTPLRRLASGDTLVVCKLDRLARSTRDLLNTLMKWARPKLASRQSGPTTTGRAELPVMATASLPLSRLQ
jgi:hypothetical protein